MNKIDSQEYKIKLYNTRKVQPQGQCVYIVDMSYDIIIQQFNDDIDYQLLSKIISKLLIK